MRQFLTDCVGQPGRRESDDRCGHPPSGRPARRGHDRGADCVDLRAKFRHGREAQLRRRLERAQNNLINSHVDLHAARWRIDPVVRALTGEHFVEHHAQTVKCPRGGRRCRPSGVAPAPRKPVCPRSRCDGMRPTRAIDRFPPVPSPIILAIPKSAIFTVPARSRRRFSGLMSRCTMPRSCAHCSASHTGGTMLSASFGVSLLVRSN